MSAWVVTLDARRAAIVSHRLLAWSKMALVRCWVLKAALMETFQRSRSSTQPPASSARLTARRS
jgi:hypothetical protein